VKEKKMWHNINIQQTLQTFFREYPGSIHTKTKANLGQVFKNPERVSDHVWRG
jgi:hypothetical protein